MNSKSVNDLRDNSILTVDTALVSQPVTGFPEPASTSMHASVDSVSSTLPIYSIAIIAFNSKSGAGSNRALQSHFADVKSDQWLPFGILPEKLVVKYLESTVLILASSSFSFNDAKRISRLVTVNRSNLLKQHKLTRSNSLAGISKYNSPSSLMFSGTGLGDPRNYNSSMNVGAGGSDILSLNSNSIEFSPLMWNNMKSLSIYGTSISYVGIKALFDLGIQHLDSLTISSTNGNAFSHKFGTYLGLRLSSQYNYKSLIQKRKAGITKDMVENFKYGGSLVKRVVIGTEFNDNMYVSTIPGKNRNASSNSISLGLVNARMIFESSRGIQTTGSSIQPWLETVRYSNRTQSPVKLYSASRYNNTHGSVGSNVGGACSNDGISKMQNDVMVVKTLKKYSPGKIPSTPHSRRSSNASFMSPSPLGFNMNNPLQLVDEYYHEEELDGNDCGIQLAGQVIHVPLHARYVQDRVMNTLEIDTDTIETRPELDYERIPDREEDAETQDSKTLPDDEVSTQLPYSKLLEFERNNIYIPEFMGVAVLRKLVIEKEPKFGDRGTVALFSLLQFNLSLEHITITDCKLTLRSAMLIARYISLSNVIQTLNFSNNKLNFESISLIIRAVANKGATGCLKTVHLQSQNPSISEKEALLLLALGTSLSVRVDVSSIVDVNYETAYEIMSGINLDADDSVHMHQAMDDLSRSSNMHLASMINMTSKKVIL